MTHLDRDGEIAAMLWVQMQDASTREELYQAAYLYVAWYQLIMKARINHD